MQYNLHAERLTLTDIERDALDKKIDRLQRHVSVPYVIDVTLTHDTHHLKGAVVTCRINIEQGKKVFHAERVADTIPDAVDEALQALKNELSREQSKHKDHYPENP